MSYKHLLAGAAFVAGLAAAQVAPYAGEQTRAIKSLGEQEVSSLLAGEGMGLAKAAELNGYPGPAHVLEHADALALTPAQREKSQALMAAHKASARALGHQLVEAERALDQAFARKTVTADELARLTAEIGRRQAQLREEHLRTHLVQTALLDGKQVALYAQLRGYVPSGGPASATSHRHGGGRRP